MLPSEYQLELSLRAQRDLRMIQLSGLRSWGTDQARSYQTRLLDILELIRREPTIGRQRDELGPELRSFPAEHHIVFYVVTDSTVIVRTILHSRMDVSGRFSPEAPT